MTEMPRVPDLEVQRAAMKRLDFLLGKWSGEARIHSSPNEQVELVQTEEAQYKLGGLILIIEGLGRIKSAGTVALQTLGIVSYDDEAAAYRMRAYNDGRYFETELKLIEGGEGIMWGVSLGDIKTSSVLRINDNGEWTELTEITVGSHPRWKFMELTVSRQE
jgi:hypothetical protein